MTERAYWSLTARSRLTVLRLGMHDCVPWALTGALAIGACPVLDRAPRTLWPEPLLPGVHFLDLGIELRPDRHLGDAADYDAVPDRLAAWLRQEALARTIAAETAAYFDRHLHPVQMGAHLFGLLESIGAPMDDGGSTTKRDRVNLGVEGRGDPSVAAT